MDSLLDSIRVGVADGATQEQRAAAALAARTFLAALEGRAGGAMPPPVAPAMPPIGVQVAPAAVSHPTASLHANIQTIATALKAGVPIEKVIDAAVQRLEAAVRDRDERWMAMMRPVASSGLPVPPGIPDAAMPGAPWPLGPSWPGAPLANSPWSTSAMPTPSASALTTPPTGAGAGPRTQGAQIPMVPLPREPASVAPSVHRASPPMSRPVPSGVPAAPRPRMAPPSPARAPMPYAQPSAAHAPTAYARPAAARPRGGPPSAAGAPSSHATPAAARSHPSPSPAAVLRPAPPPRVAGVSPQLAAVASPASVMPPLPSSGAVASVPAAAAALAVGAPVATVTSVAAPAAPASTGQA